MAEKAKKKKTAKRAKAKAKLPSQLLETGALLHIAGVVEELLASEVPNSHQREIVLELVIAAGEYEPDYPRR